MKITPSSLRGAFVIDLQPISDERGMFARIFCAREFEAFGLDPRLVQANVSFNYRCGTLRGMHYQVAPCEEIKLVRCVRGAIFDVILDLRRDSPTFARWQGWELSADNHRGLYVPAGLAHGYQTLTGDTEVIYQVSEFYSSAHERGVRWNDRAFAIVWPLAPTLISEKDRNWPDYVLPDGVRPSGLA